MNQSTPGNAVSASDTGFFGHPNGKLRNYNRWGQIHVAHDLFALNIAAHGLLTGTLLLTLHLRHRQLTATFAARQRLVQRQFT